MPRFDGTGPQGQGSMSGRGMGLCATTDLTKIPQTDFRVSRRFGGRRLRRLGNRARRTGA